MKRFYCIHTGALVCDCGLQWLSVWLREHRYNEAKARCGYPHWLKSMHLTQLHHANFTCGMYYLFFFFLIYKD